MDRIILLEDDLDTHHYLEETINKISDVYLVGSFYTLSAAKTFCLSNTIDLALIDFSLPDGSGKELIELLNRRQPKAKKIIFTIYDDFETFSLCLRHGADGYLIKTSTKQEIISAISGTLQGGTSLSPCVAKYLLEDFRLNNATKDSAYLDLTNRELEVLNLLAVGQSYSKIADSLKIKVNTVSSYIKNIYSKLEVTSKTEAVYKGLNSGIVSLSNEQSKTS